MPHVVPKEHENLAQAVMSVVGGSRISVNQERLERVLREQGWAPVEADVQAALQDALAAVDLAREEIAEMGRERDEAREALRDLHDAVKAGQADPRNRDNALRAMTALGRAGEVLEGVVRFTCPAVVHHGPGHQSTSRCERPDPHGLDDEHQVLEVRFDWCGAEAFA